MVRKLFEALVQIAVPKCSKLVVSVLFTNSEKPLETNKGFFCA